MKRPLIILTGPTAVGKTSLSIALAKALNGEIISADSMQVYQYMDIGSAKIRKEEMQGITHYLVDVLDPREEFHVARFQQMAKEAMETIYAKGKVPILVGGTGFYIQAIVNDIDFTETKTDTAYRTQLSLLAQREGDQALYQKLLVVDPQAAREIHPNNQKRIIRALEFHKETGMKISEHNEEQKKKESPYAFTYFVLNDKREKIYRQIDNRIDEMIKEGLLEEVKTLKQMGLDRQMVSMQGLGYKELLAFLDGECTLEEAIEILKRDTRHFAKRQLTWFRREKDVIWISKDEFDYDNEKMIAYMKKCCQERGSI